jgi:hypothetical protein
MVCVRIKFRFSSSSYLTIAIVPKANIRFKVPVLLIHVLKIVILTYVVRYFAGSISDAVTGIFQWLNPSGRIVTLGSTQPLTEISTRNPSWG